MEHVEKQIMDEMIELMQGRNNQNTVAIWKKNKQNTVTTWKVCWMDGVVSGGGAGVCG